MHGAVRKVRERATECEMHGGRPVIMIPSWPVLLVIFVTGC
jgi:hypothetical protein